MSFANIMIDFRNGAAVGAGHDVWTICEPGSLWRCQWENDAAAAVDVGQRDRDRAYRRSEAVPTALLHTTVLMHT